LKNIVTYHGGLYTTKPHESIENKSFYLQILL